MSSRPDPGLPPPLLRGRVDRALSCEENVVADEALLRAGDPAVRVAVLTDQTVSVGVGVSVSAPYLGRARSEGISVVRRASGGSGLAHRPGDLVWSVVLPRSDSRVGRTYTRAYGWLGSGVARFLAEHHVDSVWRPSPAVSPHYCLLGSRGEVLTSVDRIVGGAAQHLSQRALLHHGVLPLEVDRALIGRLFDLSSPGPLDRLTSLRELGVQGSPEALAQHLARAVSEGIAR